MYVNSLIINLFKTLVVEFMNILLTYTKYFVQYTEKEKLLILVGHDYCDSV